MIKKHSAIVQIGRFKMDVLMRRIRHFECSNLYDGLMLFNNIACILECTPF